MGKWSRRNGNENKRHKNGNTLEFYVQQTKQLQTTSNGKWKRKVANIRTTQKCKFIWKSYHIKNIHNLVPPLEIVKENVIHIWWKFSPFFQDKCIFLCRTSSSWFTIWWVNQWNYWMNVLFSMKFQAKIECRNLSVSKCIYSNKFVVIFWNSNGWQPKNENMKWKWSINCAYFSALLVHGWWMTWCEIFDFPGVSFVWKMCWFYRIWQRAVYTA